MRVLVAHNRYRSNLPSGENMVVDDDIQLLRSAGVDVVPWMEDSDSVIHGGVIDKAHAAAGPVYSPRGVRRFRELVRSTRPDVVHLHNVYPLISPAVVRSAVRAGVPVVQTVHNYRHTCVNALHFRDGAPCTDCLGKRVPVPAVRHRCYHGSAGGSLAMALGQTVHRGTWLLVGRYLVLSEFAATSLVAQGVPRSRVVIRPTSSADPGYDNRGSTNTVLYVGRLSEEKGVDQLVDAWTTSKLRKSGWRLRVAGSGPLENALRLAAVNEPSIEFLGALAGPEVEAEYRNAGVIAVPSHCFEGYPRVVAEALAHGRPVLASELGSLATIIEGEFGRLVAPTTAGWQAALDGVVALDLDAMGRSARKHWQRALSPEVSTATLMATYDAAIRECANRAGRAA